MGEVRAVAFEGKTGQPTFAEHFQRWIRADTKAGGKSGLCCGVDLKLRRSCHVVKRKNKTKKQKAGSELSRRRRKRGLT